MLTYAAVQLEPIRCCNPPFQNS